MSRKLINILFILGSCLYIQGIVMIIWGYVVVVQASMQNAYTYTSTGTYPVNTAIGTFMAFLLGGALMVGVGSIVLLVARIGALMELGKAQDWVWFVLMLIFGWIVLLIYLIAVPKPKPAPQYIAYPYPYAAPGQPLMAYPPQVSGVTPPLAQSWPVYQPPAEQQGLTSKPQE